VRFGALVVGKQLQAWNRQDKDKTQMMSNLEEGCTRNRIMKLPRDMFRISNCAPCQTCRCMQREALRSVERERMLRLPRRLSFGGLWTAGNTSCRAFLLRYSAELKESRVVYNSCDEDRYSTSTNTSTSTSSSTSSSTQSSIYL